MPKKDFTEYDRDQKDFEKKPLSTDMGKLLFPPKSDIKKSEDQEASVLPATPKLSMRKETEKRKFSIKINPKTGAWENLPKGWTEESAKKFWGSLTGEAEHKVTKCIKRMEGKVDDPGAFCASLKRSVADSYKNFKKQSVKKSGAKERGFWEITFTTEPNDIDLEHIADLIRQGFTSGEIVGGDEEENFDEASTMERKIKVGDRILTSSKKKAKVIKVGAELAFWMSLDGTDIGSEFIEDIELAEPGEEKGLTKEVPLEEKMGKKSFKKRAFFFQDLPEDWRDKIFQGLLKDLREDARDEGLDPDDEDVMWEHVDYYINVHNNHTYVDDWLNTYVDIHR
jgi:hypothetical protein